MGFGDCCCCLGLGLEGLSLGDAAAAVDIAAGSCRTSVQGHARAEADEARERGFGVTDGAVGAARARHCKWSRVEMHWVVCDEVSDKAI